MYQLYDNLIFESQDELNNKKYKIIKELLDVYFPDIVFVIGGIAVGVKLGVYTGSPTDTLAACKELSTYFAGVAIKKVYRNEIEEVRVKILQVIYYIDNTDFKNSDLYGKAKKNASDILKKLNNIDILNKRIYKLV